MFLDRTSILHLHCHTSICLVYMSLLHLVLCLSVFCLCVYLSFVYVCICLLSKCAGHGDAWGCVAQECPAAPPLSRPGHVARVRHPRDMDVQNRLRTKHHGGKKGTFKQSRLSQFLSHVGPIHRSPGGAGPPKSGVVVILIAQLLCA